MQLDKTKFALAAAGTLGVIYIVCAILVLIAPDFALRLLGWLTHIVNVDKFAGDVTITPLGLLIGLLQVALYTFVVAWLFAFLHNKFVQQVPNQKA